MRLLLELVLLGVLPLVRARFRLGSPVLIHQLASSADGLLALLVPEVALHVEVFVALQALPLALLLVSVTVCLRMLLEID